MDLMAAVWSQELAMLIVENDAEVGWHQGGIETEIDSEDRERGGGLMPELPREWWAWRHHLLVKPLGSEVLIAV
jgi:hypothetical protein